MVLAPYPQRPAHPLAHPGRRRGCSPSGPRFRTMSQQLVSPPLSPTRSALARPAPSAVVRERLIRNLTHAADVPVVLLAAPAGYGKTTLLAQWAQQDPRPFTILGADDDPHHLLDPLER